MPDDVYWDDTLLWSEYQFVRYHTLSMPEHERRTRTICTIDGECA
jgi:hypothetical protein